jgi:hypothetical protein
MTKLSNFTKIGLSVLGGAFVIWLVVTLAFSGSTKRIASAPTDDKHCPTCGRELPRGGAARECPYCYIEYKQSGGKSGTLGTRTSSPVVPIIIVSLIVLLLGANIFVNVRTRMKEREDETYFVYQCAKCSRRIRYREAQFRKPALCPLCKRPFVFPQPYDPHLGRWVRMKRWLKLAPR